MNWAWGRIRACGLCNKANLLNEEGKGRERREDIDFYFPVFARQQ